MVNSLVDHETNIFKSGIGDGDDLKPLTDYNREQKENFQLDFTLSGQKLVDEMYYPELTVNYDLQANCTRNKLTCSSVNYDFDVVFKPELRGRYALNVLDPINNSESLDSHTGYASAKKDDGNKNVLNIDASGSGMVERRAMTFGYTPKMFIKEVGVFNIHRYSDLSSWSTDSNVNIDNNEGFSSYNTINWDIDEENGKVIATSNNHKLSYLYDSTINDNSFGVEANIQYSSSIDYDSLVGFAFCIQDSNNFYFAGIDESKSEPKAVLIKIKDGTEVDRVTNNISVDIYSMSLFGFYDSANFNLRIEVLEETFRLYIDNNLEVEYTDSNRFSTGGFGLASYRQNNTQFDNLKYDRYQVLTKTQTQEFLRYNKQEKELDSSTLEQLFQSDYDSYTNNNSEVYTSYDNITKSNYPNREYYKFDNYNINDDTFDTTSTHDNNTEITSNTSWTSTTTLSDTTDIKMKVKEVGRFDDANWFEELFGLDHDEYKYRFDYTVYYKEENESEWTKLTRRTNFRDRRHSTVSKFFEKNNLDPGVYQWKIVQNRDPDRKLVIDFWQETRSNFRISNQKYVAYKTGYDLEISNNNFVKGNSPSGNDTPIASITNNPASSDYEVCDVEIKNISTISDTTNYPDYNDPISFFWSNSGGKITSAETDTLIITNSFEHTVNKTGSLTEAIYIDMPDLESNYPELEDLTYHDNSDPNGDIYKIKVELINNLTSPVDTFVKFDKSKDKTTINHPVNGHLAYGTDKIFVAPNPDQVTETIVDVSWSSDKHKLNGIVNGYFSNDGILDYQADITEDSSGLNRRIDINPNRGKSANFVINFPSDADESTISYNLNINWIEYTNYSVYTKESSVPNNMTIVGKTGNQVVAKSKERISASNINAVFDSTSSLSSDIPDNEQIIITSNYSTKQDHLQPWQSTISINGSVSLVNPIWNRVIPDVEQGETIGNLFDIPSNNIGNYSVLVECSNTLLSTSYVNVGDDTWKAIVKLTTQLNWKPYIHNGYYYLADPDKNIKPQEYYMYAIEEKEIINPVVADTEYTLSNYFSGIANYPPQHSPIIAYNENNDIELRRAMFFDSNNNMTLTNTETCTIKKEVEPDKITVSNGSQEIQVKSIEGNIISLNDTYISVGESLSVEYSYLNSTSRNATLTVSDNYTIELPDDYINSIYLTYADIEPSSLVIKDKDNNEISINEINDNFIELATSTDRKGEDINVEYMLKNSFLVDVNKSEPTIKFSNDYVNGVEISYESATQTSYRQIKNINLNPHINPIDEGFIFVSNQKPSVGNMEMSAYPETVFSDGNQDAYIKISMKDMFNNPYFNPDITEPVQVGCDYGTVNFIDSDGNFSDGQPDKYGNVYAVYTYNGIDNVSQDTIWANYGDLSASIDININERKIKNVLDRSSNTDESSDEATEYHIVLEPEQTTVYIGETINIEARVYDDYMNPISDTDITFTITNSSTGTEEVITKNTNSDGIANIKFNKEYIERSVITFYINGATTINGVEITDLTSVSVIGSY